MDNVDFTLTAAGRVELSASSRGHYWLVQIGKDGNIRFLRNMQPVDAFPSTPLTKKLIAATEAVHQRAVTLLNRSSLEDIRGGMRNDPEARELWWQIRETVRQF